MTPQDSIWDILFTKNISERWRFVTGDAAYWIYLALSIAFVIAMIWLARHKRRRGGPEAGETFVRHLSTATFVWWLLPVLLLIVTDTGQGWVQHIPLHLCSVSCFLLPIAVHTRNQTLLNIGYSLSIPGAIAAIVMPQETYKVLSYLSVHYFLFNLTHALIIATAAASVAIGLTKIEWKYYPRVVACGAGFMIAVYPINKLLDQNFMFVNWPEPGTILVLFADIAGNPGYVGILILVAAAVIALFYVAAIGGRALFRRIMIGSHDIQRAVAVEKRRVSASS
ncbi:MAG: YwaF family protein [Propionibacteriaceae bacterium]|jgi:uncharacterized membrane protein YwaF|nr:YwaF family protein [Propionibacteriaceae bacterium]